MSAFVLSQILVSIAYLCDIASMQFRKRESVLLCLAFSCLLVSVHYILLGSETAAATYAVLAVRSFIARKHPKKIFLIFILLSLFVLLLATNEGAFSLIPFVGGVFNSFACFEKDDKKMRWLFMIGATFLILTGIIAHSPAAIILETTFLLSNFVGFYRFYIKQIK